MITAVAFLLFLGLIVFGPKKTIEMAQTMGRTLAQAKRATAQFQSQMEEEVHAQEKAADAKSRL
jgi:Sec-independent protein translocase protein TatA